MPHHALLISDNPASAAPRRIVTALDGTADVKLRPGNYTVESDRPVAFQGKAYQWTQTVDIVAGRDAVLELTAGNAEVEAVGSASSTAGCCIGGRSLVPPAQWQDSVVALWTPNTQASGFVVDAKGLMMTNQRVIGTATSVEVQLSPAVKVAASVLVADPARDVAVLWIDPKAIASVRPVPLGCAQAARPPVADGQEIFTIGAPLLQQKGMTSGTVSRVEQHAIVSDFMLAAGSAGGPVFTAGGGVIGITSVVDGNDERRGDFRVVRREDACEVVAAAEKKMKDAAPPSGTHLPVEPVRPFPVDALKEAAERRAGSLSPYQMSSSDFDVAFITPVLTYARSTSRSRRADASAERAHADPEQALVRPLMDFSNWSEYVGGLSAGAAGPRDAEAGGGLLDDRCARRRADTGCRPAADQALQVGLLADARLLRRRRGDAHPPVQARTARLRERRDLRRSLRLRPRRARAAVRDRQARAVFGEGAGERRHPGGRSAVVQQIWQDFAPYRAPSR